ncbi:hypothetical protein POM88_052608 [Heracleum sosnowskyi]|uniref:Endonuclease/exonuclease/phosphatase domain-containing protein n=1 Tax=Heracleum sosnowskyi TaxID=360622 RepID=A0AAD8LW59_9APIA|nr:hypothetical protein POM88_052608 [Heracleum sosnowskyi]
MELQGYPFTWERYPGTNKWVEIRLDKAIATSSWMHLFKDARLINLEVSTSDHNPILLVLMVVDGLPRVRKQKFENVWLREPVCKQIVEESWSRYQTASLPDKLQKCIEEVAVWGQEFTGNFRKRIEKCKQVIRSTKGRRDRDASQQYQSATKDLAEIG